MIKYNLEFHKFARWVGIVLIFVSVVSIINILIMGTFGIISVEFINTTIEFLIYGIIIYGIGKLIYYVELYQKEMKFFRKNYVKKETLMVLRDDSE